MANHPPLLTRWPGPSVINQHEENLTAQRLSWLMAEQAFLFTAYAVVMNELIIHAKLGA